MAFEDRGLGHVPRFDERSRGYPAMAARPEVMPAKRHWPCPAVLNQGKEGSCVGHAVTHDVIAEPISRVLADPQAIAFAVYKAAQLVDEWEGENYSGTSVLAGCKTVVADGYVARYEWCFGGEQVVATVLTRGPVVIGVPWHESMYDPVDGLVVVEGKAVGGHAILVNGADTDAGVVTLHNSWGPDWGDNGEARLSIEDLHALLEKDGEAALLLAG